MEDMPSFPSPPSFSSCAGTPPAGEGPPNSSLRCLFIASISRVCAAMICLASRLASALEPLASSTAAHPDHGLMMGDHHVD